MDNVGVSVEHTNTHKYRYKMMHASNLPSGRPYLHPSPRASECLQVCARARESAGPPRTTGRAASKPGRARQPAVARRPGRRGGAYKGQRGDTRGVPRADVGVERRRRGERLRVEATTRSTPTGTARTVSGFGFRPSPQHEPATHANAADPSPIAHWCTHTSPRPVLTHTDEWIMHGSIRV